MRRILKQTALIGALALGLVPAGCAEGPSASAIVPASASLDLELRLPGRRVLTLAADVMSLRLVVEAADGHAFEKAIPVSGAAPAPVHVAPLPPGVTVVRLVAVNAADRVVGATTQTVTLAPGEAKALALTLTLDAEIQSPQLVSHPTAAPPDLGNATLEDIGLSWPAGYPQYIRAGVDAAGNVWVAAMALGSGAPPAIWRRLDAQGQVDRELQIPVATSFVGNLLIDSQDHIWVSNRRFSPDGTRVAEAAFYWNSTRVLLDRQDHLWATRTEKLVRVTPTGSVAGEWDMGSRILALALDRHSGHIWVATDQHVVRKLDEQGQVLFSTRIPMTRAGSATEPYVGLTVDDTGHAWVTSPRDAVLSRISPTGVVEAPIAVSAAAASVAVDGNGQLWVRSWTPFGRNLLKLSPSGSWLGTLSLDIGLLFPEYDHPEGSYSRLASDRHGRVWLFQDGVMPRRLAL